MKKYIFKITLILMITLNTNLKSSPVDSVSTYKEEMEVTTKAMTKPFFGMDTPIVLMWQVHPNALESDFNYLAKSGVTLIQSFAITRFSRKKITNYLNSAKRAGLRVAPYIGNHTGKGDLCHYTNESLDFVRTYRTHPAIAVWHLLDEPAGKNISKSCQRALNRSIKDIDTITPTMISTNNNKRSKYKKFFAEDAFDILEMHYYVNPHPKKGHHNLLNFFREYRQRDYPVIITLRAFNSPHKPGRIPMTPHSLAEQYKFFIQSPGITKNVGFYGWDLNPNKGIRAIPELRSEFDALMLKNKNLINRM